MYLFIVDWFKPAWFGQCDDYTANCTFLCRSLEIWEPQLPYFNGHGLFSLLGTN